MQAGDAANRDLRIAAFPCAPRMAGLPIRDSRFPPPRIIYRSSRTAKEHHMPKNKRRAGFGEVFSLIGEAIAVAAAVHRQPDAETLRRPGIDPGRFHQIGRY